MIQSIQDGGLHIMDLECRTKMNHLRWIQKALTDPTSTTAERFRSITEEDNIELALAFKSHPKMTREPVSPFYALVLKTWLEIRGKPR